jgi:hypothetical protein
VPARSPATPSPARYFFISFASIGFHLLSWFTFTGELYRSIRWKSRTAIGNTNRPPVRCQGNARSDRTAHGEGGRGS